MSDDEVLTPVADLIEEIAEHFSVYIGSGRSLTLDSVVDDFDPNLNIQNLDDLIDLHFLLSGTTLSRETEQRPHHLRDEIGVRDFVSLLPRRIRRLETTTSVDTEVFHGEVHGQVDWQQTLKARYRQGAPDSLEYACRVAEEDVATPNNRVLHALVAHLLGLHNAATDFIDDADHTDWFDDWRAKGPLVDALTFARSHVYLGDVESRLPDITDRTLQQVHDARSPLYREAADLCLRYRHLHQGSLDSDTERHSFLRELFSHEFLHPEPEANHGDATLFELYWIFRLLDAYGKPRLRPITHSTDCVAAWVDSGHHYALYHDWSGGDILRFEPSQADTGTDGFGGDSDGYLARHGTHIQTARAESAQMLGHARPRHPHARRPDFVLLKRATTDAESRITDIAISEVKYSPDQGYVADGVEELLGYLIFARYDDAAQPESDDDPYFTSGPDYYETPNVHGFLCIDNVSYTEPIHTPLTVWQTGDSIHPPF